MRTYNTDGSNITVYTFGHATEQWPNLVGVFQRAFPAACMQARAGKPQTVTYHGERFTISPRANE